MGMGALAKLSYRPDSCTGSIVFGAVEFNCLAFLKIARIWEKAYK
jgi:hypothetical protein